MLERVAAALTRWCLRWVPDGYVIAGVLTAVVVAIAIPVTGKGPLEIVKFWGDGFWGFVPFTLQMAMVILTGYVVAQAPPVRRALVQIAELPATPRGAIALMALVSMSLAWVNWGLSLVGSAILATRIGRRPIGVDYRLLVATAYLGMGCVWHAGLSASAPLTSSNPAEDFVRNYLGGPVPITETLFRPFNLGLAVVVIAVMLATAVLLHPKGMSGLAPVQVPEEDPLPPPFGPPKTVAEWLERKPFVNLLFGAGLLTYLVMFLLEKGVARVNIGHVNLLFLALGVVLHWSPASFLRAAEEGGRNTWGVLLQFGLYAGVGGILDKSGLATMLADAFRTLATPQSFPVVVVWYSGILNYVVPSGGAKWLIEVQYLAEAARSLGVPLGDTIVAYSWGDMLTDIIQPFWAIPLLAVARLGFRDIMGYCVIFFVVYAAVVTAAFLLFGFA